MISIEAVEERLLATRLFSGPGNGCCGETTTILLPEFPGGDCARMTGLGDLLGSALACSPVRSSVQRST